MDRLISVLSLEDITDQAAQNGADRAAADQTAQNAADQAAADHASGRVPTGTEGFRVFEGPTDPQPGGHVFGGQVMGQAIVATGRTVPEGRFIHSMFSYFLRPGDPTLPIRFEVDALRDGGSFSVRRVLASQNDQTILAMTASFQEDQDGLEHIEPIPDAPDPESLPSTADLLGGLEHPVAQYWAHQRPIDIRHVNPPVYMHPDPERTGRQMVWMRALAPLPPLGGSTPSPTDALLHSPSDALLHDAILAYASDYTPFEPMMRRQGLTWITPGLRAATINHAIWWHSRPNVNEWLLYVQNSPSAAGGRGLTEGRIYRQSGDLVATVTQEGMLRIKPQS